MSILDREREIAHTQNQIKHSTCTVYTASPEELEKLLNGRNGMGRTKGSKNKKQGITIDEKRLALQSKIEKQKSEREKKVNETFENILSLPNEGQPTSEPPHAGIQIIPIVNMQPEACLVPEGKVKSDTAAVTAEFVGRSKEIADEINQIASQKPWLEIKEKAETPLLTLNEIVESETDQLIFIESAEISETRKRTMDIIKHQYRKALTGAARNFIGDEIARISDENAVEVLSNLIEISITIRKEFLVK